MKRVLAMVLVMLCLLSGCSMFDGRHVSIRPHEAGPDGEDMGTVSVENYSQLYTAIRNLIHDGIESAVIAAPDYPSSKLEADTQKTIDQLCREDPIAAYAVDGITYEAGKSGGHTAVSLTVGYFFDRAHIQKIKNMDSMEDVRALIAAALNQCQGGVVFRTKNYVSTDFEQLVTSYVADNPHLVMEEPQVAVSVYPQSGADRVVELRFWYQTSRDALRGMQEQVRPVFTSAALYVSGDAEELQKFDQLSSFLMERFDYQHKTSITPAYSLLCHGVGDSRAVALVYGAMCRQSGLDCGVVSGTCEGQSRFWNIVCVDGVYYHVDLFSGSFNPKGDEDMNGYVWDYSAYPKCGRK